MDALQINGLEALAHFIEDEMTATPPRLTSTGDVTLPSDPWHVCAAAMPPYALVPATSEEPPLFWFRGRRIRQVKA